MTLESLEWWRGQVVAHLGGGKSLVRIGKHDLSDHRLNIEIEFQTELLPIDCRALGSNVLASWQPIWAIVGAPKNSN